jgi:ATP-dependent helicase HrpA
VADAVEACLREGPGDVLVFLPGEREILEAAEILRGRAASMDCEVAPLYGRLGDSDQDRAIGNCPRRRVTLATNIAETSLTVPGIRWVVDAGQVRMSRWSPKARVQRLLVEPASRASLEQRKGRAGRVAAGTCVRLFSEADFAQRADASTPEILRSNLAGVVLRMKDLGLGDPSEFPFIDPPGERRLLEAEDTLREIGAIDRTGALTGMGRQMARLPVDPRVARVLLEGVKQECGAAALTVAAWLSSVDPRERPGERAQEADLAHAPFRDGEGDLIGALRLWQAWREAQSTMGSSALRRWCRERMLNHRRLREWSDVRRQLERLLRERLDLDPGQDHGTWRSAPVHRAVLAGFATQAAVKGRDGQYRLSDGSLFTLHPRSGLARAQPPWVVALEIVDTGRRQARVAARIQPNWVEHAVPHLVKRTLSEPHWVRETGQVAAWERVSLGQLDLIDRRRVPYGPVNPADARVVFLRVALVEEQLGVAADFLDRNRAMRVEAEAWAQARRRTDLLADADAVYRFYDERVPASVHSRPDFERWRREAERRDPAVLRITRDRLITETPDDTAFPREFASGSGALPMRYAHAPGTDADGVTLQVPLVALPALDIERLEWSVPGQRVELVEALIRALPRRMRARFQPVEEFAAGFLQAHAPGQGALVPALAAHLSTASGLEVRPEDFERSAVAPHLRPRVEVTHAGEVLAASRDLQALRHDLLARANAAITQGMQALDGGRWCGRSQAHWPAFAPRLPVDLSLEVGGTRIQTIGTLDVGPDGVRTGWTSDRVTAERSLRRACVHLCLKAVQGEVRHHLDFDPNYRPLDWSARGLGAPASLVELAALLTVTQAWPAGHPVPTSETALLALLDAVRPGLFQASHGVLAWMEAASRAVERLDAELARPAPAAWGSVIEATRADRAWLLDRERLESLDPGRLARVPVLLGACTDRLRRLSGGGATAVLQGLAGLDGWLGNANASAPRGVSASDWLAFVWLVREARLGLFAREGGPWPRVRDLEAAWGALSRSPTA